MMKKQNLLFILLASVFLFTGCKKESDSFDLLISGDASTVEDLEITARIPDQASVTLQVGESQQFAITAVAPAPRTVSYSWTLNGSPLGAGQTYTFSALAGNIGNHSLIATASDGESTKSNEWTVKVNGPPVITPVTTGTPKVSVGSTLNISATATDPNNDSLTYTWLLNGATSAYLTGTTGTGTLTGHDSIVGAVTVTLQVSDGTETASYTWNSEVNHFPMACNTMTQGQICTYSGGPHKGNGLSVTNTQFPLRFRPIGHTQDALGNFFISDLDSNVVWYWNKTGAAVTRLGQTIAAGVIQVVAGTGEASTGGTGVPALSSALNNPRGLWYNDGTGTLYIAEYSGHNIKYVDNTGTVFVGLGGGTSHVDGTSAFTHDCNNPTQIAHYNNSLYVSCYSHHRVKRWDLATDLAYVAAGDGGNDVAGNNANPVTSGIGNPYGLYVDANGIYVGSYSRHVVRFINHTAGAITFWSGNPDQVIVAAGMMATIIGDGGTGEPGTGMNPLSESIGRPVGITVRNNNEIYVSGQSRDDLILVNNSGAPITVDANGIYVGSYSRHVVRFINHTAGAITFWSGNPDQVIVAAGMMATIIGDGGTGEPGTGMNPLSESIGRPVGITVRNNNEIYVSGQSRDDLILVNNSGAPITVDALTVNPGLFSRINHTSGGYNGNNGINSTRINDTYSISVDVLDNDKIILADYSNYRLREMDLVAGDINLLAGSGRGELGFYGDIVLPTQEHLFNYPTGIAFEDSTRTLFFADQNNHRLRQTDAYGRTSTALCRGGGDPNIDNDFPSNALCRTNINGTNTMNNGFDIWSDGTLAVLNGYGHNVRLWNRSGSDQTYLSTFVQNDRVNTVAGDWISGAGNGPDGPALNTQYRYPNSVKFYDNAGNMELWILDTMNHCLRMVDSAGNSTTMLGLCGTSGNPGSNVAEAAARFNRPRGLLLDSVGNVYISDYVNHTIWYWNRTAAPVTIGTVTVNPNFVAKIACLSGTGGSSTENVFATTARCNQPTGLAMNGNNLCYAQRNRHNVRCIDITTGLVNTVAGRPESAPRSGSLFDYSQEGISATSATLSYPSGVAFDSNGDLYISDTYNHVIRKVKLSP